MQNFAIAINWEKQFNEVSKWKRKCQVEFKCQTINWEIIAKMTKFISKLAKLLSKIPYKYLLG